MIQGFMQKKISDGIFKVGYRGRHFLVNVYPIKIVEMDRSFDGSSEDAQRLIRSMTGSEEPHEQYDYSGFAAVEFIATTRCNLRCTHCTARSFDADEQQNSYYGLAAMDMTYRTMVRAIDDGIQQCAKRQSFLETDSICFEMFITGGEPILVWNDLYMALKYARDKLNSTFAGKDIIFTPHIVTNGTLIDETIAAEMTSIGTIVTVALDTPMNQLRVDSFGNAATPAALDGLNRLIQAGHKRTSVNIVVAGESLDRIDTMFDYLDKLGAFDGITTIQLSPLAPPIQHTEFAGKDLSKQICGYNNPDICDAFSQKLIEYSSKYKIDMKLYGSKLGAWLSQGGTKYRCPVAKWKWCLDPIGDVFACHQLVGIDEFRMGNINDHDWYDSTRARSIRQMFLKRTVFSADLCGNCVLASSCMVFTDCPARSYLEMGDIFKVAPHYCRCGKTYLEQLFGEHIINLVEEGQPAKSPFFE